MWLEVSEDLAIDADCIISIEKIDQMNSIIYTEGRSYKVAMPKTVLMSMVESRKQGRDSMSNVERLLTEMYKGQVAARP